MYGTACAAGKRFFALFFVSTNQTPIPGAVDENGTSFFRLSCMGRGNMDAWSTPTQAIQTAMTAGHNYHKIVIHMTLD